ncbi:ribose 5-phosphate isomerase A [Chromatiales bacterium (ex Bugula neritina AB1)]|nr:ribose 5-phosphate isomerase A [Chromatiales bacterium (ex Bugula neritina AB1)]
MSSAKMKKAAANAAMDWVTDGSIIGVGTGSTADFFIEALAANPRKIKGAVASSDSTADKLSSAGIELYDLNSTGTLSLYVDGADEANQQLQLIKGGGGALTREKIVAAASTAFVCIADSSKQVTTLGQFPLPIEVLPMARSFVAREIVKIGGDPELRDRFTTDNGNVILDIHNMEITNALELEHRINQIAGIVTCGLFAHRPADILLVGQADGSVEKITRQ